MFRFNYQNILKILN